MTSHELGNRTRQAHEQKLHGSVKRIDRAISPRACSFLSYHAGNRDYVSLNKKAVPVRNLFVLPWVGTRAGPIRSCK